VRRYRYHPHILAALEHHGLRPRPGDEPRAVYELLKSIYTFEVRGLRARHREKERLLGPQPFAALRRDLLRVKARYPVLHVPPLHWAVADPPAPPVPRPS
jgi:hypothetical protein